MVVEGKGGFNLQFFHHCETGAVGKRPNFVLIVAAENCLGFDKSFWCDVDDFPPLLLQKVVKMHGAIITGSSQKPGVSFINNIIRGN